MTLPLHVRQPMVLRIYVPPARAPPPPFPPSTVSSSSVADDDSPDTADVNNTPASPTQADVASIALRDSAGGDVQRTSRHVPSLAPPSMAAPPPPVNSFADFPPAVTSDTPPA